MYVDDMRKAAPEVWKEIIGICDRTPLMGFEPTFACMMVCKIADDHICILTEPFAKGKTARTTQIVGAYRENETENQICFPVGVVFIGKNRTPEGRYVNADEIVLVSASVSALASALNKSAKASTDLLMRVGTTIASKHFHGQGPGGIDLIRVAAEGVMIDGQWFTQRDGPDDPCER